MDLYAHQQRFLAARPTKTALVWSCGTGKTRAACEWGKLWKGSTFIICPKPLKQNWIRECKKWGLEYVYVYTKEEFRRDAAILPACTNLIVDEIHNGFLTPHFKSQMSKALRNYLKARAVPHVLFLSATIYTSSPWNVYQLAVLLGHKWNWAEFNFTFFAQVRMGGRIVPVAKKGIEERLAAAVKKIADVVDIHECMDVPEQLHLEPEYYGLTDKQKKAIEDSYDPSHIVRYTKQHEIENAVLIGDPNGLTQNQTFESDKIERIKDLVAENRKIAIVCRYNLQIDLLFKELAGTRPIYIIRGDVKNRDEITLAAEAKEECIVLIQADCAEGYQLPSFELCVFASQSYSYAKYEQVCGRFLRMDKPSRTTFMYLLTEGASIDQAVYDSVGRKEDFQISLYRRAN